jgi:hypothetical protein
MHSQFAGNWYRLWLAIHHSSDASSAVDAYFLMHVRYGWILENGHSQRQSILEWYSMRTPGKHGSWCSMPEVRRAGRMLRVIAEQEEQKQP